MINTCFTAGPAEAFRTFTEQVKSWQRWDRLPTVQTQIPCRNTNTTQRSDRGICVWLMWHDVWMIKHLICPVKRWKSVCAGLSGGQNKENRRNYTIKTILQMEESEVCTCEAHLHTLWALLMLESDSDSRIQPFLLQSSDAGTQCMWLKTK